MAPKGGRGRGVSFFLSFFFSNYAHRLTDCVHVVWDAVPIQVNVEARGGQVQAAHRSTRVQVDLQQHEGRVLQLLPVQGHILQPGGSGLRSGGTVKPHRPIHWLSISPEPYARTPPYTHARARMRAHTHTHAHAPPRCLPPSGQPARLARCAYSCPPPCRWPRSQPAAAAEKARGQGRGLGGQPCAHVCMPGGRGCMMRHQLSQALVIAGRFCAWPGSRFRAPDTWQGACSMQRGMRAGTCLPPCRSAPSTSRSPT
jgi:hypothetical protein